MPYPVALRSLVAALSCLVIALLAPNAGAQASEATTADGPTTLLELYDSTLIARAWESLFPDSVPPPGDYQVLIPAGPQGPEDRMESAMVFILRDGTEAGQMDRGAWNALAAGEGHGWAEAMAGPEKSEVPLLWSTLDWDAASIVERAEWPAGFLFAMSTGISSVRTSKPQFQRDLDFAWDQKLFGHFLLGASLHRTQFGGGLTRLGERVADTADGSPPSLKGPEFSTDAYWWWSITAGVPGVKYTLNLANQPLPRYFWLETRASPAVRTRSRGRLVNQWTGSTMEREGNFAHTLDARYGVFRYSLHWDSDAYRVPIQDIGVGDIHALFGNWGGGLIIASDLLATRISLDIPDAILDLGIPEAWPTRFRLAVLHVEFAYRNTKNFSMGLSMRLRLENPIMNRPGA